MYINSLHHSFQTPERMSASVITLRNAKLAAFRALLEPSLGEDIVNTIGRMAGEMTTRIQPEAIDEDHSLALSDPVPSLSTRSRIRVHVQWLNAFGRPTHLVCTYIPDTPNRSQLAYNTGHGFTIYVASIEACVMVFTRAAGGLTDFFVGNMNVGEFRRVVIRDGFEVCVSRAAF